MATQESNSILSCLASIVLILKAIESLKFLLRSIYISLKTVKIVIIGKNRIFSVRAYDQQTFTISYVLNAVVSYLDSLQNLPTKFPVAKTTSFVPLLPFEVPQGKTKIKEKIGWFFHI